MNDHDTVRNTLMARLTELDGRLHDIEETLEAPHSNDWEEAAVEREGDEVLEALGAAGQSEIAMIKAALARLDAGEYGICQKCGDAISPARLDLLPHTPICAACG